MLPKRVSSIKYLVSGAKYKIQNTIYGNLPKRKDFLRGLRQFKKLRIAEKATVIVYIFVFLFGSLSPYFPLIPSSPYPRMTENGKEIAAGVFENPPVNPYAPIKQTLADNSVDLTIKESSITYKVLSDNKKDYDIEKYRYGVTLSSGTRFNFGLESKEGLLPKVRIQNESGYFISYYPSGFEGKVTPKVEKNVISWEISDGITARYAMQQDRVKADYIVNEISNIKCQISNCQLEFEVSYGKIDQESKGIGQLSNVSLEEMPGGDLVLLNENAEEQFTIPASITFDKNKKEIGSEYRLSTNGKLLNIILSPEDLASATWPLTIDPVTIDASADATGTQYGNSRKIFRDSWGNLIAIFIDGTSGNYTRYKNYSSNTWSNPGDMGSSAADITGDLDSAGNIHVVFRNAGDIRYQKATVPRNGSNEISGTWTFTSSTFFIDDSALAARPSIIIANKGGGSGVEKVVVAYSVNTTGATPRGEIRFMQCDVSDDCTTAGNWKNASEEINGSGTCSDGATSGDAGLPDTTANAGCKGTTDIFFQKTDANTKHHVVLAQMPGSPKRNAGSVKKDLNGTFSDLNNLEDGSSGTTDNINSLTTTDYLYVGDLLPFSKVSIDIDTTNSNAQTFSTTQYCSANTDVDTTCDTWTAVSNFVDNTATGTTTLLDSGDAGLKGSFLFDEPSDWVQSTENSTKEFWTRFRPSGALDSTVSLADIYLTDRNSKALLIVGGRDDTDDLGAAYIPWDEITNAGWENRPDNAGNGWKSCASCVHNTGGNWTDATNYPLTVTVDYINNRVYVAYYNCSGAACATTSALVVMSVPSNLALNVGATWGNNIFPSVSEGVGMVLSLTSDGADIYLFYILNPGTTNLVYRKCTPSTAGLGNICDDSADWSSEATLVADATLSHPQAVVTKAQGDTIAIDIIYTDTTDLDVLYERHYVNNQDKTVVVAASGDDAYHRDCISGTDDQDIAATTVKLGREAADASCAGSVDSENHTGLRFPSITVVQGAAISSAYIDLHVSARIGTGTIEFSLYGQDADNAVNAGAVWGALTDCTDPCTNAVNTVTKTTSTSSKSVDFAGTTTAGSSIPYRIDVTSMVQEIICRGAANSQPCVGDFNGSGTWASGNALAILLISTEGGADNSITVVSQDDTTGILEPTLQVNCLGSCSSAASSGKNYSLGSALQLATGSASFSDLDHPFSSIEFSSVGTDDTNYASLSATTQYASSSAVPAMMFKVNNTNNDNAYKIDAQVIVKSSVPTSTKPAYLQVYRGGATDDWVTKATNNDTAANTEFTLTSPSITTNTADYYINETPGIGTLGADCTDATANCWTYWRVYQDAPTTVSDMILYTDYVSVTFSANGPDKVAFSNSARTLTVNACNGSASVFTMELQSGTTPTNPVSTTVVRVTSNSTDYTIYSDDTCSTTVTDGDFTYTTAQNTKSVYIVDNKKSVTTRTLTGTRQSGDTLTTGTQNYTVNAGTTVTKLIVTMPGQTFADTSGNSGSTTNRTAGSSFNIVQITATDNYFNIITGNANYDDDDRTLVYAGPANAPDSTAPTYTTAVHFTNGVSTTTLATTLYKAETVTITVTDGGSFGQASSSFTVDRGSITPSAASVVSSVTSTTNINTNVTIDITLWDTWENPLGGFGGGNISFTGTTGQFSVTTAPGDTNASGVTSGVIQWSTQGTKTVTVAVSGHGTLSDTHAVTVGAPTPRGLIQGGSIIRGGSRL